MRALSRGLPLRTLHRAAAPHLGRRTPPSPPPATYPAYSAHVRSIPTLAHRRPHTIHTSSAAALRSTPAPPHRAYTTQQGPNQHQVWQSFGTPLAQFLHTLSRIARILSATVLGVGALGLAGYEATHQYVEHVAMRALAPPPAIPSDGADEWGWAAQLNDEAWSSSGGTDARLGVKARHAVRSAWMCVHWGAGISPSLVLSGAASGSAGLGRRAESSIAATRQLHVQDGLGLAIQYMEVALEAARKRGICLPDAEQVRWAGSEARAGGEAKVELDSTALALETKMAGIKERQGSRTTMRSALETYEALYHLIAQPGTLLPRTSGGPATGRSADAGEAHKQARLARLACKVGELHAALGETHEAEAWLKRALIKGTEAKLAPPLSASEDGSHVAPTQQAKPTKPAPRGWLDWIRSKPPHLDAARTPTADVLGEATPVQLRTHTQALVSLSALYAASNRLHHALAVQDAVRSAAARRLARPSGEAAGEMHDLFLAHLSAVAALHSAETCYALHRNEWRQWMQTASDAAGHVLEALESDEKQCVAWSALRIVTRRTARDAKRVRALAAQWSQAV
ncbi:hypothetical protein ACQY0O_001762 [Thecaphora frezii]